MAEIKVKRVGSSRKRTSLREQYATVCYFYPQYTLKDVQEMPARDLNLLLKTAQKQEAIKMYNMTSIVAAPHSKKQVNVKKLLDYFGNIAKD